MTYRNSDHLDSSQRPPGQRSSQQSEPQQQPQQPPPSPDWRLLLWFVATLFLTWYWLDAGQNLRQQELAYTAFKDRVEAGDVVRVTLHGDRVNGILRTEAADTEEQEQGQPAEMPFVTTLPPMEDPRLLPLLEENGVTVDAESQQTRWFQELAINLLPWVLIFGLFWYAMRKMQERTAGMDGGGGIFGFGKSQAKRFHREASTTRFKDVAGLENAKRDLEETIGYLKNPDHYRKLGAKIPKGVLLMGPPGTGKTLLARAVAGEADVPFFSISGSEFIEMFVGVGASRVRDMFKSAKKEAPSIIFIDEIDSIGRARGTGVGGGHDEREQTLNQILGEMDGFDPQEAVVVLAATNRPDVLDRALLRPGRFDRKVTLDLPDRRARTQVLKIHTRDVPLQDDVDLEHMAALTIGFSSAELENLVNEAALLAGHENRERVDMELLQRARDKLVLGSPRENKIGEDERELIAFHEAGHAVAARCLPHADPLDKVTIIPRGQALGATEQIPEEDRHNLKESYLRDRIGVMLGGRVSEQLVYGEVSSGAEADLTQATRLARRMVARWGMSDKLGPVTFSQGEEHVFLGREMTQQRDFSEATAQLIDQEIRQLIQKIEDKVTRVLQQHRQQLDRLAEALLEKETLGAEQIRVILDESPS